MKKIFAIVLSAMLLALCFAVYAGAAEYVYYENDFSDPATLSDFTIYRGEWDCVDGKLMVVGLGELTLEQQAWMLYSKDEGIMNLTDYILEVDMNSIQTQAGPLVRCDIDNCIPKSDNGFCGYLTFVSFSGTKGAIAYGKLDGQWGNNLLVSEDVLTRSSNIHMKSTLQGTTITCEISDLETGTPLWTGTVENDLYAYGTFGFRVCLMKDGVPNINLLAFDNLKVTAIGEVGDHLAAGKALKDYKPTVKSTAVKPDITPAIEVNVPEVVEVDASKLDASKTEYVYYENDFSDPATISDFTQYRGNWVIKDGVLQYESVKEGFNVTNNMAFLAYSANHNANLLENYTMELDVLNSQSNAGLLTHADLSKISSNSNDSFYGYLGMISNNGTFFATAWGNDSGGYGGNLELSDTLVTHGNNYHLVSSFMDGIFTFSAYDLGSDVPLWTYEGAATRWSAGTFGLRVNSAFDLLVNVGTVSFDNMKVTVYGEQAILLNAGYEPNAKIVGELKVDAPVVTDDVNATVAPETTDAPDASSVAPETTDAPDVTVAPETTDASVAPEITVGTDAPVAPETTDAPEVDEPVVTTAPTTAPEEDGGAPVGIIIGIVAAVVVIAAIVAVVLKKKKN